MARIWATWSDLTRVPPRTPVPSLLNQTSAARPRPIWSSHKILDLSPFFYLLSIYPAVWPAGGYVHTVSPPNLHSWQHVQSKVRTPSSADNFAFNWTQAAAIEVKSDFASPVRWNLWSSVLGFITVVDVSVSFCLSYYLAAARGPPPSRRQIFVDQRVYICSLDDAQLRGFTVTQLRKTIIGPIITKRKCTSGADLTVSNCFD